MRKQVVVRLFNETPGAFRYREVDAKGEHIHGDQEGALIGDLYLRKATMLDKTGGSALQLDAGF
jgi:hypothetical protein